MDKGRCAAHRDRAGSWTTGNGMSIGEPLVPSSVVVDEDNRIECSNVVTDDRWKGRRVRSSDRRSMEGRMVHGVDLLFFLDLFAFYHTKNMNCQHLLKERVVQVKFFL